MEDNFSKDLQRAIRQLQMADPLKGLRESIAAIQMADPTKPWREAIAAIQMADPLKGLRESIAAIQMADPAKPWREAIAAIQMADPLKGLREALSSLRNLQLVDFERLDKSYNSYRELVLQSSPANSLEDAYLQVCSRLVEAADKDDTDEALSAVAEGIRRDAIAAPNTIQNIQFLITLLVAFVICFFQYRQSVESEHKVIQAICDSQTVISQKLDRIMSARANEVYFVVERPVNFRLYWFSVNWTNPIHV